MIETCPKGFVSKPYLILAAIFMFFIAVGWVLFIQIFQISIAEARTTYVEMYYLQTVEASLFTVRTKTQTRPFCLYKGRLI